MQQRRFEPEYFEAFIAALFNNRGYRVELTPYSGDKGADVIAHQCKEEAGGFLIQVKQCQENRKPGSDAVREIVAAKPFYEEKYGVTFHPMVVTNREFTKEAHQLSRVNQVKMYERKWLMQELRQHPVTRVDVDRCWLIKKD